MFKFLFSFRFMLFCFTRLNFFIKTDCFDFRFELKLTRIVVQLVLPNGPSGKYLSMSFVCAAGFQSS